MSEFTILFAFFFKIVSITAISYRTSYCIILLTYFSTDQDENVH